MSTKYLIATQQNDSGTGLHIGEDGRVVTRFIGQFRNGLVTDNENDAHHYGNGDAQTVRDDYNDQFPHYRFYLVEV